MVQVLKYKCCGKVFAACWQPVCNTDKEWKEKARKAQEQGHKTQLVDFKKGIEFGECNCKEQLKLFTI